ncbi:protein FAM45A-like [Centruroides sculpturatus]|uniref:protein FAM45A-like n=1 Tax=Centruroides sculpturatus TaxID=218467 RepID=UPI000C6D1B0A|nr:protein FAM45A-like [Centruroides sculpturatus]
MAAFSDLISSGLIEKDTNKDVLWTWSFPSITSSQKSFLLRKCNLDNEVTSVSQQITFRYYHFQRVWFYLYLSEVFEADKLPRVRQFVLVLKTKDFNPEKYETLCRILSKTYCKTGDPAAMLRLYLSVAIKGCCATEENGTFLTKDFDQKTFFSTVPIKAVIRMFGLETILIYTALILKKRIVVYHHHLDYLLSFLRALPALVWHRQDWDILYPDVDMIEEEMADLTSNPNYVAGFQIAAVEGRHELYDIFVNLAATEISVATHAKETFTMSKMHKDIAVYMVRHAENENSSDQQVIKVSSKLTFASYFIYKIKDFKYDLRFCSLQTFLLYDL